MNAYEIPEDKRARRTFRFKQFAVCDAGSAMKLTFDAVLLGAWAEPSGAGRILDIGTGCGILALMMAQKSESYIDAVEIDPAAASQSLSNFLSSPWPERLRVFTVSFQEFSSVSTAIYDLILCNPPYFSRSLKPPDKRSETARHKEALPDEALLEGVGKLLKPTGKFCLILPFKESQDFLQKAISCQLYCNRMLRIVPREGKPVNRVLAELSRSQVQKTISGDLTVRTADGEYTPGYKDFAKDFYLNF